MELKEFKVGQKVWVRCIGDSARGKTGKELIQEWVVVKIGKKYVYAEKRNHNFFHTRGKGGK